MSASGAAVLGVFCFLLAGFVRGMEANNNETELILAVSYALVACGALGVLAGGVAAGIRMARD